jgi:hypothetical protein
MENHRAGPQVASGPEATKEILIEGFLDLSQKEALATQAHSTPNSANNQDKTKVFRII